MTEPVREMLARDAWREMRDLVLDNERRKEVSRALDLSFNRVKALMTISEAPLSMRELATDLGIDAPYATVVVDDLERRGLVERSVSSSDRRAKVVDLTIEGRTLARRARSILERPPVEMESLSMKQLSTLHHTLSTLMESRRRGA